MSERLWTDSTVLRRLGEQLRSEQPDSDDTVSLRADMAQFLIEEVLDLRQRLMNEQYQHGAVFAFKVQSAERVTDIKPEDEVREWFSVRRDAYDQIEKLEKQWESNFWRGRVVEHELSTLSWSEVAKAFEGSPLADSIEQLWRQNHQQRLQIREGSTPLMEFAGDFSDLLDCIADAAETGVLDKEQLKAKAIATGVGRVMSATSRLTPRLESWCALIAGFKSVENH